MNREQCDAELDNLQEIDVATHGLVVVGGLRVEFANGSRDNTGELCILRRSVSIILAKCALNIREYHAQSPRLSRTAIASRLQPRLSDTHTSKNAALRLYKKVY